MLHHIISQCHCINWFFQEILDLDHFCLFLFTSVGRPKHIRVMAGALEGDIFIGPKAEVCGMINFEFEIWLSIVYSW